ncbi:TonB-dependent receptor domain-containing protein [Sphingomonas sp. LHG3443-2]|uniref:TonB-dependent receptor domain-containing protein n=1 Tax=Sphingomonas sp. LHG3443-2 TaxID=2804639 RepID=UPI003CF95399
MGKFHYLGTTALRGLSAATILIGCASAAQAQQTAQEQQQQDVQETAPPATSANPSGDAEVLPTEEVVVTGSRIRTPNLESAVPVTTVRGEEVFQTGGVQVGDVLNDLPQLRSTYSTQNSTRFLGTRGLNLLDLRGLGSSRTLVLVNGRRHVAADVLGDGTAVDINTIPADLIERIDVVTGGASAVYGSDAVAGVVNFILRRDFDGLQLRAQSGISKYGDAANQFVAVTGGKNFAGGRGNIAATAEFSHTSDFYASGRPFRQADNFVIVDTDPAGSVNGSDGIPDRIFLRNVRRPDASLGGGILFRNGASAPCGRDTTGAAFSCSLAFQPDGSLTPIQGVRVGLAPTGSFIGGAGYNNREGQLLALSPDVKRYSFNVLGHFEVADALVPFVEAKYVRVDAIGSQSGPFFTRGQTLLDSTLVSGFEDRSFAAPTGALSATNLTAFNVNREGIRLDNPFLTSQARNAIRDAALASLAANINPNTGATFATTGSTAALAQANRAALIAQVNDGSFRFGNRRDYLELGIRDEDFRRETYRIVGGLRGDFNTDWSYELSLNYGQHKERNLITGNVNTQRFLLASDSAINPATGQIVCRSQLDPRYAGEDVGGNPAILAADVAACVPINPFGVGNVSQAAKDYLTIDTLATGKITQLAALGYVAGDLSQLFELPGGPIGFSVGAEYRRQTLEYDLDDLTQAGYAFYNAIPAAESPAFSVKEAFAEVNIPILKDMPFFHALTVKGAGRLSKYKGIDKTIKTYGVEGIYSPVRDITFRGAYNRSVRAPNLAERFGAASQNFAPGFSDPCAEKQIGAGSVNREANCAAAGRPAGYDYVYAGSLEYRSGGNPDLEVETSDSLTLGGYIQPRFIPGLSISADYYDIKVKNVITSIGTAQDIANLCYDSPTLDNPFCALFQRAGASGGPNGEEAFRIIEGSLLNSQANFAKLRVRGIDTQLNYVRNTGIGRVNASVLWTHQLRNESFTDPSNPSFKDVFLNELGDPQDQVNLNLNVKRNRLTVGYQGRWIGKMYLNTYEDYNSVNGDPPQNTDYAEIEKYPAVMYHDLRAALDVTDKVNFYLGVDNVLNKLPPYGSTGVGGGSGIWDNRGRYFYTGFVAKF